MTDNDLIRRGDAREALRECDAWSMGIAHSINALPAVQPTVSPDVAALVEAAKELQSDMLERAECGMDVISGEQYRVVNAGNGAWVGFCAAIAAWEASRA